MIKWYSELKIIWSVHILSNIDHYFTWLVKLHLPFVWIPFGCVIRLDCIWGKEYKKQYIFEEMSQPLYPLFSFYWYHFRRNPFCIPYGHSWSCRLSFCPSCFANQLFSIALVVDFESYFGSFSLIYKIFEWRLFISSVCNQSYRNNLIMGHQRQ